MTFEELDETRETLAQARLLIEAGWYQRKAAQTSDGMTVSCHCESATRFCLLGALLRVAGLLASRAWEFLGFETPDEIARYNDHPGRTKAGVLALLDEAIG